MRWFTRALIWIAITTAVLIGLLRATAIRWWRIPTNDAWLGASVTPTMNPGDLVVLWRLTVPAKTDLVLCPEPGAPERVVIGRIAAAGPRDEITTIDSSIEVNGRRIGTERGCGTFTVTHPRSGDQLQQLCSVEDYDQSLYTRGNIIQGIENPKPMKKMQLEDGEVFLISDNRQFPFDSRDFGPVKRDTCRETFVFRLWSQSGFFSGVNRFDIIP